MKIVESRQKALLRLASALRDMDSCRGRLDEIIDMIWPYCSSDAISVYQVTEGDNLTIVSWWGRLTPHQSSDCYRYNINEKMYQELLKGEMMDIVQFRAIGCNLPALQEEGIKSALIFPITAMGSLDGVAVFISYTSDVWPSDTIEWISIVIAMITAAIRRTVVGQELQKQLEWRDKIYPITTRIIP